MKARITQITTNFDGKLLVLDSIGRIWAKAKDGRTWIQVQLPESLQWKDVDDMDNPHLKKLKHIQTSSEGALMRLAAINELVATPAPYTMSEVAILIRRQCAMALKEIADILSEVEENW